jgi:hypothetical protein
MQSLQKLFPQQAIKTASLKIFLQSGHCNSVGVPAPAVMPLVSFSKISSFGVNTANTEEPF